MIMSNCGQAYMPITDKICKSSELFYYDHVGTLTCPSQTRYVSLLISSTMIMSNCGYAYMPITDKICKSSDLFYYDHVTLWSGLHAYHRQDM